jgi:hypothetical protein
MVKRKGQKTKKGIRLDKSRRNTRSEEGNGLVKQKTSIHTHTYTNKKTISKWIYTRMNISYLYDRESRDLPIN